MRQEIRATDLRETRRVWPNGNMIQGHGGGFAPISLLTEWASLTLMGGWLTGISLMRMP